MPTTDDAYEQAKQTLPSLRASFNSAFSRWSDLVKTKLTVSGFEDDEIGGRHTVAALAKALFAIPAVQEAGDTFCRAFYPGLYFTDVPAARDGAKVKADISRTPTVLVITDIHVVIVNQVLDGWIEMAFPREAVTNPRWITVGGMLVQPKFWCLQFDTVEDDEVATDTVCLGRGFTSSVEDSIRADVERSLTVASVGNSQEPSGPPAIAQRTTAAPRVHDVSTPSTNIKELRERYPISADLAVEQFRLLPERPDHQGAWLEELCRRIETGSPPAAAAAVIPLDWAPPSNAATG